MKKKETLFYLIKSMTKSEKRNFRLESSRFRSNPVYMKLFDLIDQQHQYDEKVIKKVLKDEKSVRQFHVLKNYLKQCILKSLRSYHAAKSKEVELNNSLSNLNILFNKELYQLCDVEIKKAERIAREYELYPGLNELYNWKRKLAQTRTPSNFKLFKQIIEEQKQCLDHISNQHDYYELIIHVSEAVSNGRWENIENIEWLDKLENATTFESKVLHLNARYIISIASDDPGSTVEIIGELSTFFDKHSLQITQKPGLYLSSMNNALSYFIFSNKLEKALQLLEKLKSFSRSFALSNDNISLSKQILRTYNQELEIYRRLECENTREKEIEFIETEVDRLASNMPEEYLISFWFQLANICFFKEDYKEALKYVNKLLDKNFGVVRQDIQLHARILNLMTHFEMGNIFVLRYFVDSAKRMMKKLSAETTVVKDLLHGFSLLGRSEEKDYTAIFTQMHSELIQNTDAESNANDYIDYRRWLKDKCMVEK